MQIIEIPDVIIDPPPIVKVDSNNNVHMVLKDGQIWHKDELEEHEFYYRGGGYYIHNYNSKNLEKELDGEVTSIEIDSNDNVYLVYHKNEETIQENITIHYSITGHTRNETRKIYNITLWLQKRAPNGDIIFDKNIANWLYEEYYMELNTAIKFDTNYDLNIVYWMLGYYSDEIEKKYVKLNNNGDILIDSIDLEYVTLLPDNIVIKDENGNLNFIQNQVSFFPYYYRDFDNNFGLIDNDNNINIFYVRANGLIHRLYSENGTIIGEKTVIKVPEPVEYYKIDDEIINQRILTWLLIIFILMFVKSYIDLSIYAYGNWKLKNKKDSIFAENTKIV